MKKKIHIVNIEADNKAEALRQIREQFKDASPDTKAAVYESVKDIDSFFEGKKHGSSKDVVFKTMPTTDKEWEANKDIMKRKKVVKEELDRLSAEYDKWWAEIRLRLPDGFSEDAECLKFNEETGMIEYLREK